MFTIQQTAPTILCCMCGIPIPSNPSNMCVNCIRSQVDITEGIPKQLTINFCKFCGRYLNPPNHWVYCELESKELLALCLKKVRGLNKVKLVDAGFVWTEPHSRRLKVKLTIQKEVFTSTILQQVFVVEFVVQTQMCDVCHRQEAKDTWNAVVQARQKVDHKKTFLFLEQLILKHNAHINTTNVKEAPDGLDFYYNHKSHAMKMVDFLQAVAPIRFKQSDQLVSHDDKNNTANIKYTFSVEIVPVCRDDLVCLPIKLANTLGNISPLLLCYKVSSVVHLVDPLTLQACDISPAHFWTYPFRAICNSRQFVEYTILDINPLGPVNGKFQLAEVMVARSSDFGRNDTTFIARTHLGSILKPGDYALGYDLSTANFNDADLEGMRKRHLPDLILVKKSYPERRRKTRQRHWKLKTLDKEVDDNKKTELEKAQRDREMFMRELEEDPELRSQINLYKEKNATQIYAANRRDIEDDMAENAEEFPEIGIEELMEELDINDDNDM